MKLNLKQLETFILVADLGSFRLAAERLNTTQPNVSSRISSLEETLGVGLMARDAGSVRLTTQGAELLEKARRVMRSVDEFIETADSNGVHDNIVRVGVTEMVAHTWLNQFLKEFKELYPNVLLELSVDLATGLERELLDRTLDLTFQSGPFTQQVSGNFDLGTFPMVWVASPKLKVAKGEQINGSIFQQHPVITHAKNTIAYQEISRHFQDLRESRVRLIPSSNLLVSVQMVVDGYGIGALLEPLVERRIKDGSLNKLHYQWAPENLAFFARFDQSRASRVIVEAALLAQRISNDFLAQFSS